MSNTSVGSTVVSSDFNAEAGLRMLAQVDRAVRPFLFSWGCAAYRSRARNAAEAQHIGDPKRGRRGRASRLIGRGMAMGRATATSYIGALSMSYREPAARAIPRLWMQKATGRPRCARFDALITGHDMRFALPTAGVQNSLRSGDHSARGGVSN